MLTALISFNSNNIKESADLISNIGNRFMLAGINIDSVSVLSIDDLDNFKLEFTHYYEEYDNIIVLNDYNTTFDINSTMAEIVGLELFENKISAKYSLDYCEKFGIHNIPSRCKTPDGAIVIPNENGIFQPYYITIGNKNVVLLPSTLKELDTIIDYNIIPLFVEGLSNNGEVIIYKLFGDSELESRIEEFVSDYENVTLIKTSAFNDITAIFVPENDEFDAEIFKNNFEYDFYEEIYSDENSSLAEKLLYYLSLNNFMLGVAESFTSGRISASVVKKSGASANFNEGIVAYSNDSKIDRLNVQEDTLNTFGAVSENTAREMVVSLLNDSDFAISTTGIAGPKSDSTLKPVGLCYIGVGMKDNIEVKEFHYEGDRETITEIGKNNALFLAIKMLQGIS